jgi:hypothetical protein
VEQLINMILKNQQELFEKLWKLYPLRDGKKSALKHFLSSVKTDIDFINIQNALKNYKSHLRQPSNAWKKAKNGSTWFNNWKDWITYTEERIVKQPKFVPMTKEQIKDQKIRFSSEFQHKLRLKLQTCWRLARSRMRYNQAPANMW